MTAAEIVPTEGIGALETLDPAARESAVTLYLTHARTELAHAVEASGPAAVAALKAEIATAAEATKQLGLSKEIQQDAQEMVRRAEYALGKAIRAGQDAGTVRRRGEIATHYDRWSGETGDTLNSTKASPTDFAKADELHNGTGTGIYNLVDGVTDEQFEEALEEARADANVSRANVVRKLKEPDAAPRKFFTAAERIEQIRALSGSGKTSGQIGQDLGIGEARVRDLAREAGVEITADRVMGRSHRLRVDSDHIVSHAVMTLEVLADGASRINYGDLDRAQLKNWADSLKKSLAALNGVRKSLEKEQAQ